MFEYKVVPAPVRAARVKGLKSPAERFAHTLTEAINAEAAGGWQFLRTETLPCEYRKGLGGLKTTTQTVMIFAREIGATRPDTGAALAAAQLPEEGPISFADTPADHAHEAPAAPEPAMPAHDDQPRARPAPAEPPRKAPGRQEPLFRTAPLARPAPARPEPVLRPPAAPEDEA